MPKLHTWVFNMKKILNKLLTKRNIIRILIGISLILLLTLTYRYIKNTEARQIKKAEELYEKAHNLYFYGKDIEYAKENGKYVTIERSVNSRVDKYYKLSNYNEVFVKLFSSNKLKSVDIYLGIIEQNNGKYIREIGRGLSGYFGTTFEVKKASKTKITYIAKSKFCEISHRINDVCESEEYYYTIDKEFTIIKENGKWKIDEYTSVFEFEDSLIK